MDGSCGGWANQILHEKPDENVLINNGTKEHESVAVLSVKKLCKYKALEKNVVFWELYVRIRTFF